MNAGVLEIIALADEIEAFIQDAIPKAETIKKYGGTLFTVKPDAKEGQFCGVFVQKTNVQISFSKGTSLKDPKSLLQGTGKLRRHINISSSEELNKREMKKLLKEASRL